MLKIAHLDDAFSEVFLTTSKPSRRSITAAKKREKEKKERRKKNSKNRKTLRRRSLNLKHFDFCACPSHNAPKRDAGGKNSKLLCCKRIFDRIKGNLAEIQPKITEMSKNALFAKSSRSQWVKLLFSSGPSPRNAQRISFRETKSVRRKSETN